MKNLDDELANVEWFMSCLVLHGAVSVSLDLDNKQIKGIKFRFLGGRERYVDYSNHPARPMLMVAGGNS